MGYAIVKIMVQGQHLNTAIENVWKTMIFKLSYLMKFGGVTVGTHTYK